MKQRARGGQREGGGRGEDAKDGKEEKVRDDVGRFSSLGEGIVKQSDCCTW